jgi:hypothetical protein
MNLTDYVVIRAKEKVDRAGELQDGRYRAMPYNAPQSLSANEVYAVTAWLLHRNGIVPGDAVLDARTLPQVRMPTRDRFVADTRRPGIR